LRENRTRKADLKFKGVLILRPIPVIFRNLRNQAKRRRERGGNSMILLSHGSKPYIHAISTLKNRGDGCDSRLLVTVRKGATVVLKVW
jgi:hypothetical protein